MVQRRKHRYACFRSGFGRNLMRREVRSVDMRPTIFILLLLFACGLLISTPVSREAASQDSEKRVLHLGYVRSRGPGTFPDEQQFDRGEMFILAAYAERLFRWKPSSQGPVLELALAESWPEVSEDGLSWVIRIKPNVKFGDSEQLFGADKTRDLHAMDVVSSLKFMALSKWDSSPADAIATQLRDCIVGLDDYCTNAGKRPGFSRALAEQEVSGLTYSDPWTVQLKLRYASASLAALLAHPACSILPKEYLTEQKGPPVTTGPFNWTVESSRQTLAWNPKYREERWPVDELEFTEVQPSTFEMISSKDAVDFCYLPTPIIGRAPKGPDGNIDTRFVREDGCGLMFLAFNMADPIWGALDNDGRALRKAVAQALDRAEWIKRAPAQTMTYRLAEELIPPRCWPTGAGSSKVLDFNRDAAKQTLAGCKFKNGIDPATGNALELKFVTATGSVSGDLFEVWREGLAELGIVLTRAKPSSDHKTFEAMRKGEGQLFMFGWLNDVPDVGNYFQIFAQRNIGSTQSFCNYTRYQSKEFEKLLSRYETLLPNETNAEVRRGLVREMISCLEKDAPLIPMAVNQEWSYRYGSVEWPDMPRCAYDHVRHAKWKQR